MSGPTVHSIIAEYIANTLGLKKIDIPPNPTVDPKKDIPPNPIVDQFYSKGSDGIIISLTTVSYATHKKHSLSIDVDSNKINNVRIVLCNGIHNGMGSETLRGIAEFVLPIPKDLVTEKITSKQEEVTLLKKTIDTTIKEWSQIIFYLGKLKTHKHALRFYLGDITSEDSDRISYSIRVTSEIDRLITFGHTTRSIRIVSSGEKEKRITLDIFEEDDAENPKPPTVKDTEIIPFDSFQNAMAAYLKTQNLSHLRSRFLSDLEQLSNRLFLLYETPHPGMFQHI